MIVSIVCSVYLLIGIYSENQNKINYFLYDHRRKRKVAKEALTPEFVCDNLDLLLSDFTDDLRTFWLEFPRKLTIYLKEHPAFRPLVCYRMLLLLSQITTQQAVELFSGSDLKIVAYICRGIRDAGDRELADYIFEMKENPDNKKIAIFFKKNEECFSGRILRFVQQHLSEFSSKIK